MKIHTLAPAEGAVTEARRLGRGIGSGLGKTSGKGHKGQWARSGGGVRPGFEGGTMPITRRIPKRGFKSQFRAEYTVISVSDLEMFDNGSVVTIDSVIQSGLVSKAMPYGLKVIGNGALTKSLTVQAKKFTKSAAEIIEKAGGKAEVL